MSEVLAKGETRDQWGSRASFIFASVGAAVGFGNVWRFPSLAYEYGGGAFFIPYLLALFVIGIPLLILELALGQYYRTGDMGAFGGMHARLRGVGVASVGCSFAVVLYYIPLIAWTVHAFFASFKDFDTNYQSSTGGDAYKYWMNDIIGMNTLGDSYYPTRVVWSNFGCLVLCYAIIFGCVAFGMKTTGKVAYFTMGFPILLLFIFLIRACSLEGAGDGIKAYIGMWDMKVLYERRDVWSRAVSQIFFSIGVTFGIFTAYGSGCPKDAPVVANSFIIALSNSFFSFVSGFAIYAVIGNLALNAEGGPVAVADVTDAGPGLVFGTYPVALSQLAGGQHWVRLFFIFLFLLGIDSGFGLFEAFSVVINDTILGDKFSKRTISAGCAGIGILVGLIFVTDAGFIWLDVVDWYVNFVLLLVGFFEVFGAGWIFGIEDQISEIGSGPVLAYMFTEFGSVIIGCIFWFGGFLENSVGWGFLALIVSYTIGMGAVLKLCKVAATANDKMLNDVLQTLVMGNVLVLRERLSTNISTLPWIWAFNIKHVMPPLLLICFANLCAGGSFFTYGGYVTAYQVLGLLCVLVTLAFLFIGVFAPQVYANFLKLEITESVNELNGKKNQTEEVEA